MGLGPGSLVPLPWEQVYAKCCQKVVLHDEMTGSEILLEKLSTEMWGNFICTFVNTVVNS